MTHTLFHVWFKSILWPWLFWPTFFEVAAHSRNRREQMKNWNGRGPVPGSQAFDEVLEKHRL